MSLVSRVMRLVRFVVLRQAQRNVCQFKEARTGTSAELAIGEPRPIHFKAR